MVARPYPPRARGSPPDFRYYFALVVKNQIVYLAMADKSISDIEAAHRFLKDISTKCALHVFLPSNCLPAVAPSAAWPRLRVKAVDS